MRSKGDGRPARVGERIRQDLMDLLLRGAVKDPSVEGVIVHAVDVTGDLRQARVYVRLGEPDASETRRTRALRGLERAAGFLRQQVGRKLGLRHAPELSFRWDDAAERAARVEELLESIRAEGKREP
jgi:ribosome-binding factor A